MRLGSIAHHVAPMQAPFAGGVESLTWYLTRWLGRHGHEVILYSPPGSEVPASRSASCASTSSRAASPRRTWRYRRAAFMAPRRAYQSLMIELAQARRRRVRPDSFPFAPLPAGRDVGPLRLADAPHPAHPADALARIGPGRRPGSADADNAVSRATADSGKRPPAARSRRSSRTASISTIGGVARAARARSGAAMVPRRLPTWRSRRPARRGSTSRWPARSSSPITGRGRSPRGWARTSATSGTSITRPSRRWSVAARSR